MFKSITVLLIISSTIMGCSGEISARLSEKRPSTSKEVYISASSTSGTSEFLLNQAVIFNWNSVALTFDSYTLSIAVERDCANPIVTIEGITETKAQVIIHEPGDFYVCLFGISGQAPRTLLAQTSITVRGQSILKPHTDAEPDIILPIVITTPPPTHTKLTKLNLSVEGENAVYFEWGFSRGVDCNNIVWSTPVSLDTSIEIQHKEQGQHVFCARGVSAQGNRQVPPTKVQWTFDNIAPTLTLSAPAASAIDQFTLSGNCETGLPMQATGDDLQISNDLTCNNGSFTATFTLSAAIGQRTIAISQTDLAGNTSNVSHSFQRLAPQAVLSGLPLEKTNSTDWNVIVSGERVSAYQYALTANAATCSGASYSSTRDIAQPIAETMIVDGPHILCVLAVDSMAGLQQTPTSHAIVFDSTKPSVNAFVKDNAGDVVKGSYVASKISAVDTSTNITHACTKFRSIPIPADNDPCWQEVTAGLNISDEPLTARTGLGGGYFTIYVWVKDEAGNSSSLSNNGSGTDGVDRFTVLHVPSPAPKVTKILAANTPAPSPTITASERVVAESQQVFIKWKAVDFQPLAPQPISIFYTTDGTSFTEIASGLANGSNQSCEVNTASTAADDHATGCFTWTSTLPTGSAYWIRVTAKSQEGHIGGALSQQINGSTDIIVGQPDAGIGLSATLAKITLESKNNSNASESEIVDIASDGTIYYRDFVLGIMYVDPVDGILRRLAPLASTSSGDNGPIANATISRGFKIAVDYQDRILVHDRTAIRMFDRKNDLVTTLIGGGTETGDTIIGAKNIKLTEFPNYTSYYFKAHTLLPMPNGDIYFYSEHNNAVQFQNHRIRRYVANADRIDSVRFTGVGHSTNATFDVSTCGVWDVAPHFLTPESQEELLVHFSGTCPAGSWTRTNYAGEATGPHPGISPSQFYMKTGKTGRVYGMTKGTGISRYVPATRTWLKLLKGAVGKCADDTLATGCDSKPMAIAEDQKGNLYFLDTGMLRVIDSSGRVQTLFGRDNSFGEDEWPIDARIYEIGDFDRAHNGELIVFDRQELLLRSFVEQQQSTRLAGNGINMTPASATLPKDQGLIGFSAGQFYTQMAVNPANGDVFLGGGASQVLRLNRQTNTYTKVVGGGTTSYVEGDGLSSIRFSNVANTATGYPIHVMGFGNNAIAAWKVSHFSSVVQDSFIKSYVAYDDPPAVLGTQSHLAGMAGSTASGWCGNVNPTSCRVVSAITRSYPSMVYDSFGQRWLFMSYSAIRTLSTTGANTGTLLTTSATPAAFDYYRNSNLSTNVLYWCQQDVGKLFKQDIANNIKTEVNIAPFTCLSPRIKYDANSHSIYFAYFWNGVEGIARVPSP